MLQIDNSVKIDIINLLKTSQGQIGGIIRMMEDNRYCVDVSRQVLAVQALLKKINLLIIDRHIKSCVKEAFIEGKGEEKVDEIIALLDKYIR